MTAPTAAERAVVKKGLERLQTAELRWFIDGPAARAQPDAWRSRFVMLTSPLRVEWLIKVDGALHNWRELALALGREGVISVVREILADRGEG